MSLTSAQKTEAARRLALQIFPHDVTATVNLNDLIAAIGSIDSAMDTVLGSVPAPWLLKTVKQALIDNLPEPFKSNSTAAQKAAALSLWSMKEAGIV